MILSLLTFSLALLQAPATPAPSPADRIVEPLREIGRVHARTAFCTAFVAGASPAVSSALDFETRLVRTVADLRHISFSDELAKQRTLRAAEADLNALADLVAAGRGELHALRQTAEASKAPARAAVISFVDALDGAKGQQMQMARKLSRIYGTLAEHPVYSLVLTPADDQVVHNSAGLGDWLMTDEDTEGHERSQSLFDAGDKDIVVGSDLERAGQAGRQALALGGC